MVGYLYACVFLKEVPGIDNWNGLFTYSGGYVIVKPFISSCHDGVLVAPR